MIKLDTETCGLTGPVVLIQHQQEHEQIVLHQTFTKPVQDTLTLIENLMEHPLVIFNATFDSFHLNRTYNVFRRLSNPNQPPDVDEVKKLWGKWEPSLCLKPKAVYDPMLLLKEGPLNFLFARKPILINKVPAQSADLLLEQLNTLNICPLLHAEWSVLPHPVRGFVNFKLKTKPSIKLKPTVEYLFDIETIELGLHQPRDRECIYNPYNTLWFPYIQDHIRFWSKTGQDYAKQDITLLEILIRYLKGELPSHKVPNTQPYLFDKPHMNSELAWCVGTCRQEGYSIDTVKLKKFLDQHKKSAGVPTDHHRVRPYLLEVADPIQKMIIRNTSRVTLEALVKNCEGQPVAERAKAVLKQRELTKQIELLSKIEEAGRFHPDFNIIGTFSNRMSGTGGINPQGINNDPEIRELFTFANNNNNNNNNNDNNNNNNDNNDNNDNEVLSGGDFAGQEVSIAAAVYNDPQLNKDLGSGKSIHVLIATEIFEVEYDEVTPDQKYVGKNGFVFPMFYGSTEESIATRTNLPLDKVREIFSRFFKRYPNIKKYIQSIYNDFCSMRQDGGIGTPVVWKDPKPFIESLYGWRRYFDLENTLCKAFFTWASNLPEPMRKIEGRCYRSQDREQSIRGATQSALFAAAFQMQAKNLRAANNHRIQATGAHQTKTLQWEIWKLQPTGVHPFKVKPFNVHDEILCPTTVPEVVNQVVENTLKTLRETVPLIDIEWKQKINNWSEK